MNFHISKTLLFKINKCILTVLWLLRKRSGSWWQGISFLQVLFSKWTIFLALCLIAMWIGAHAADAFGLFLSSLSNKGYSQFTNFSSPFISMLRHGHTCLSVAIFVWVKWVCFALLWTMSNFFTGNNYCIFSFLI